jgi:predicted tellurium resistance membrane protein TerC
MASLSDLPEDARRRVLRLGYWTWLVLVLGATAAILFVRKIAPTVTAPLSAILVLAFVVMEVYQPILVRRLAQGTKRSE